MRSPKLAAHISAKKYLRYYAGFSDSFVEDMLVEMQQDTELSLVIDPWNGSGTTTTVASRLGIAAAGYDINPVAIVLSKSNLLNETVAESIVPLASEILANSARTPSYWTNEPLETWFGPKTAQHLRRIERTIHRVLVQHDFTSPPDTNSYSSLAAGFYVILFKTVRELVQKYVPSNPTWIKRPDGRRIGMSDEDVKTCFALAAKQYAESLAVPHQFRLDRIENDQDCIPTIQVATSAHLPLKTATVSGVLSSPPYCTRIDYVKATLPELAVLGLNEQAVRLLRDQMIGTPTMSDEEDRNTLQDSIGPLAAKTLGEVTAHPSRASSTYYRKYYEQYFMGMAKSLKELKRVCKPGANAVLVVQDSYYKEHHIDLPEIVGDIALAQGWRSYRRIDFDVPRTMAAINQKSRQYRTSFNATESAVILD